MSILIVFGVLSVYAAQRTILFCLKIYLFLFNSIEFSLVLSNCNVYRLGLVRDGICT